MLRYALRLVLPVCLVVAAGLFSGCAYIATFARQAYYRHRIADSGSQRAFKHLLQFETFFVYGRTFGAGGNAPVAIVALSGAEVVDSTQLVGDETHYGLNLPAGTFELVLVRDDNNDGAFDQGEVLARRTLILDAQRAPEHVVADVNLQATKRSDGFARPFSLAVSRPTARTESLFYPRGTLRTLDDPVFSPRMAELGMYAPAAFLEEAPMMFYALEEFAGQKVPVIFVHGINGSPRDFAPIVAQLDRRRYQPWFFYYPSGGSLTQLGAMFYEIFLSGRAIPAPEIPVVIVAHSMGGLVVREGLNHITGKPREARVGVLVTIASPLGGHPSAGRATRAPVVLPSWRDLAPDSRFVADLYRKSLPRETKYYLAFTFQGDDPHAGDDGVVPVSSQRRDVARAEATHCIGFQATHTGVLVSPEAVSWTNTRVQEVKSNFTADRLAELDRGGYSLPLSNDFNPVERFIVRNLGFYMDAVASGKIPPRDHFEQQFVDECRNHRPPTLPASSAWQKLEKLDPQHRRFAERGSSSQPADP